MIPGCAPRLESVNEIMSVAHAVRRFIVVYIGRLILFLGENRRVTSRDRAVVWCRWDLENSIVHSGRGNGRFERIILLAGLDCGEACGGV